MRRTSAEQAIEAYEAEAGQERARFLSAAARGRPEVRPESGRTVELRRAGQAYPVEVRRLGPDRYRVEEGGVRLSVGVERLGLPARGGETEEWRLSTDGSSWRTLSLVQGRAHHVEVEGVPHRFTRDHQGLVVAPAPAIVVSVAVAPGDEVQAGQPLLGVE